MITIVVRWRCSLLFVIDRYYVDPVVGDYVCCSAVDRYVTGRLICYPRSHLPYVCFRSPTVFFLFVIPGAPHSWAGGHSIVVVIYLTTTYLYPPPLY